MRRFEFRLEAVRQLREREEAQARAGYERALAVRRGDMFRLHLAEGEMAAWREEWMRAVEGGASGAELRQRQTGALALKARRELCFSRLEASEAALTEALEVWREAARRLQGLDLLREKKERAHRQDGLREEQKMLDDMKPGLLALTGGRGMMIYETP